MSSKNIKQILSLFLCPFFIHVAYCWPNYFGFFVIAWIPFFKELMQTKSTFLLLAPSCLFFCLHFYWILDLLIQQSSASWPLIIFLYSGLIILQTCFFLCFVSVAKKIIKHVQYCFLKNIIIACLLAGYFISMEEIGAGCLGTKTGYPFLHPLLPLIHLTQDNQPTSTNYHFIKLRPITKSIESLYHHLEQKSKKKRNTLKQNIFVTPELAIIADLDLHQNRMQQCLNLLHPNDILIVSGLKTENENIYHQLYFYTTTGFQGRINKKNLIPLYEYIPAWLSKIPWLKDIFLKNKDAFSPYHNNQSKNIIINNQNIEGNICSDFFTQTNTPDQETTLQIIVANDEPMAPYIARLMLRYVILKQQKNRLPTFYVGWRNNLKIF